MLTCDKCNAPTSLADVIGIGRGAAIPATPQEVVRIYCRACGQAAHRNLGKPGADALEQAHRVAVDHLAAAGVAAPPTIPYPTQPPERPVPPPPAKPKAAAPPPPAEKPRLHGLARLGHFLGTTTLRLLVPALVAGLALVCIDSFNHPKGAFQGLDETYRSQFVKLDRDLPAQPTWAYLAALGSGLVVATGLLLCFQGRSLARWFLPFVALPGLTPLAVAVMPSPRPRPFFAVVGLLLTFLLRLSLLVLFGVLTYVVVDLVQAQADFRTALTAPLSQTLIPEGKWPFDWTLPAAPLWKYLVGWVGVVALLAVVLASALGRPPEAWFVQSLLVPPLAALCMPFSSAESPQGLGVFLRLLSRFCLRLVILGAVGVAVFVAVDVLQHHQAPEKALLEPLALHAVSLDWQPPQQPLWMGFAGLATLCLLAAIVLAIVLKRSWLSWVLLGVFLPLLAPLVLALLPTGSPRAPRPARSSKSDNGPMVIFIVNK